MSKPATDRLKFNPPLGMLPALQFLLPSQLNIDAQYQRSLDTEASVMLVRSIAQHWNWDLCQPLVVARRADGQLYVIDGQHRLAAARLRGDIAQLPAVVVQYGSVQDEAASFVHLNQQRKPLGKLDLFKAAVASGDSTAVAIVEALVAAGLSIAPHQNYISWKPGMVSNIGGIEACWRSRGAKVTSLALRLLGEAYHGQVLRYAGTIFPGIAAVIEIECKDAEPDGPIDDQIWELLVDSVGAKSQEDWRSEIMLARANDPNLRFASASERVLVDAWAAALGDLFDGDDGINPFALQDVPVAAPEASPVAPTQTKPAPASVLPPVRPSAPKVAPKLDWGRITKATAPAGKGKPAIVAFKPDEEGKAWCRQCDRRRTRAETGACKDSFCPFGGKA